MDAEEHLLQDIFRIRIVVYPAAVERQQPAAILLPDHFQLVSLLYAHLLYSGLRAVMRALKTVW